ncbi:MAG: hypothetical protein R2753_12130 [Chitinophagales bacterium]
MTETLINVANPEDVDQLYLLIEKFKPELTDKLSSRSQIAQANIKKKMNKLIIEKKYEEAHIYLNKCESYADEIMLTQMALGMMINSLMFDGKSYEYYANIALSNILKKERLCKADKAALFGIFLVIDKGEFLEHFYELVSKENSKSIYFLFYTHALYKVSKKEELASSKDFSDSLYMLDDEEIPSNKKVSTLKIISIGALLLNECLDQLEKILLKEQFVLVDLDNFNFILKSAISVKQYWWTYKLFTDIKFSHLKLKMIQTNLFCINALYERRI